MNLLEGIFKNLQGIDAEKNYFWQMICEAGE
jgi:hypothetical protein